MFSYKAILENLYGIAYLVDRKGCILDYSEKSWNDFAVSNNSYDITKKENIIGRPIYDFIADEETKESYKKMNEILFQGHRDKIHFCYRCDAPEYRRDMKMLITPIKIDGEVRYVLYQSIILSEILRPAMNIFKIRNISETDLSNIITICSYCKNIKMLDGENDKKNFIWVTPEEYYKRGGKEDVMLSHGICSFCYENIVLKYLPANF